MSLPDEGQRLAAVHLDSPGTAEEPTHRIVGVCADLPHVVVVEDVPVGRREDADSDTTDRIRDGAEALEVHGHVMVDPDVGEPLDHVDQQRWATVRDRRVELGPVRAMAVAVRVGVLGNGDQRVTREGHHGAGAVRGEVDEDRGIRALAGRVAIGAAAAGPTVGTHQQVVLDTTGRGSRPLAGETKIHSGDFSVEMVVEHPTTNARHQYDDREQRENHLKQP